MNMRLSVIYIVCVASLAFTSLAFAGDYHMASLKQLVASPNGGRVAWSPGPNNLIAYDRLGASGFYDVWTMNPDGGNPTCVTCNWQPGKSQSNYNKGNPDWDPTGNYLVIQVQRGDTTYGSSGNQFSRPGLGEDDVLYIVDAAGKNPPQLIPASATFAPHNGGVLHPHFSHGTSSRGVMLLWAQETSDNIWEIQQASFSTASGAPSVNLQQTLSPGGLAQCSGPFYETHGFSLDDSIIFFSGNPSEGCGGKTFGYDVYSYNLNTQVLANLTNTPAAWEEHARPSPVEEKLIYISSYGLNASLSNLLQEYWTMNYDGSDKKKITWITDPRAQTLGYYIPGASSVGDNDWSHDGIGMDNRGRRSGPHRVALV